MYRQGGDEFAVVLKCSRKAAVAKLYSFHSGLKKEINGLVNMAFMSEYLWSETGIEKGKQTLKERQKKKVLSALKGIEIEENIKQSILKAIDKTEITFAIDKIGISTGVFIPYEGEEKYCIGCAEIAQDAAKDIEGKNQICIYYEETKGVIPTDKTKKCMKKGCYSGSEVHDRSIKYVNGISFKTDSESIRLDNLRSYHNLI